MGKNRSSKRQNSFKVSNSHKVSVSVSNKDMRSYNNADNRSYQNKDQRSYKNVDSRDMSTTVNNIDNSNISKTALNCGVDISDVQNYTNDESININQDNSQNIVITGDGNTLENVTQKMNLTSYAPEVQKCMQKAVTKMASANKAALSDKNTSSTSATSETKSSSSASSRFSASTRNRASTDQSSRMSSEQSQTSKQRATSKQAAGMAAAAGGFDFILAIVVIGIIYYANNSLDNQDFNPLRNFTEYLQTSFNSTHLVIILLMAIIFYEFNNN